MRDTSLRLRPCGAVVDGAAANGDTPGHFETSRFTTRGIFRKPCGVARRRSLRRCIFPLTAAVQMTCSPWIRRGLSGFARCCGPPLRGRPSVRPSRRHAPAVPKIGRASGARRLAPRALQPHCAAVGGVERDDVTNEASSDKRNSMTAATSSGSLQPPILTIPAKVIWKARLLPLPTCFIEEISAAPKNDDERSSKCRLF